VAPKQTVFEKMTAIQQKDFCVLQFSRCESAVTVQREFRQHYRIDPPGAQSICWWYGQFEQTDVCVKARAQGDHTCLGIMCKESECFQCSLRVNQPRQSRTGNSSYDCVACFEMTLDYEATQVATTAGSKARGQVKGTFTNSCGIQWRTMILLPT
jgi:hypothetical protein